MSLERQVGGALKTLTRVESVVAVAALCLSAGALLADIFTREVLGFGLFGSLRVAVYTTAIAALLGFGICISDGTHLRVSVLDGLTGGRLLPAVSRLGHLVSFAICAYLAWWAGFYVHQTFELGETDPSLGIQVWPVQAIMPWVFASGAVRYLAYFAWPALAPAEQGPTS